MCRPDEAARRQRAIQGAAAGAGLHCRTVRDAAGRDTTAAGARGRFLGTTR